MSLPVLVFIVSIIVGFSNTKKPETKAPEPDKSQIETVTPVPSITIKKIDENKK